VASGKSDRKHLSSDDSKADDRNTFSRYDDKGESAVRLEAGHDGNVAREYKSKAFLLR
jgi:hypothetical protein